MSTKTKNLRTKIRGYILDNLLFLTFIISSLINAFLLRAFTVKFNYNQIKPVLADIAMLLFIGLFGYLIKPKRRFVYYLIWTVVFVILTAGNSIYYTNYRSFLSFSLLSTASQLGGVMDAVTKNIMEPKDLIFLFPLATLIAAYIIIRKKLPDHFKEVEEKKLGKKYFLGTLATAFGFTAIFAATLTSTDVSRLAKQWNREYVLGTFGLYTYQISDSVSSLYNKLRLVFGYEKNEQIFREFYEEKELTEQNTDKANEYTNIFKGKNVIAIHAESIQQFTMDTWFNGEEVTPNLNRLASEGLYFSNFYAQESVGTSSDTEFTFASSLMPASSGTVAINYWDRTYVTTQTMLRDMGYYTFSMHGNNGSFWNRMNLHATLGYERFYNYSYDFVIDDEIGLGLSDKSFFSQAVPIIKEISEEHDNFYGTLIMLTNHTPFTDIDRVSDFDVTFKYTRFNEETGLYEEIERPFLEGTKLGSYFKSVHYADEALGQLMEDLDEAGLLENTVVVIYGDHDAKIKEAQYEYYYNYNPFIDETLDDDDPAYIPVEEDGFYYSINRKVPLIIWSKDGGYEPQEITRVMGMYDAQPTLGNMLGFSNTYALGHDIFSFGEGEENTVIFPDGNFVTDTIYYDSQKERYFDLTGYANVSTRVSCNQVYKDTPIPLYSDTDHGIFKTIEDKNYCEAAYEMRTDNGVVGPNYISEKISYAEERIDVSNTIIYYDIIYKIGAGFNNGIPDDTIPELPEEHEQHFAPPHADDLRDKLYAA